MAAMVWQGRVAERDAETLEPYSSIKAAGERDAETLEPWYWGGKGARRFLMLSLPTTGPFFQPIML